LNPKLITELEFHFAFTFYISIEKLLNFEDH